MHSPSEEWHRITERDQQDPRWNFNEYLRSPRRGIEEEIRPEKMRERYEACQAGIEKLTRVAQEADPDVVVVISNPHGVAGSYQMMPTFGIFLSETRSRIPRSGHQPRFSRAAPVGQAEPPAATRGEGGMRECATDPELSDHLMEFLRDQSFDLGCSYYPEDHVSLDHAFTELYDFLPQDGVRMVPLVVSRYLPNQATSARCYALGQGLRRAIEAWNSDQKVAIMASGGLSHQLVDQELDRMVVDSLLEKDERRLCSLPRDRLNRAPGTPEILNWVTLAGAMESQRMTLIDYLPCYQSRAGSGHGVTFAYWK